MSASDPSISIIIPTRNEVENIAPLVSQIVAAAVPLHEIVFVDADSTDGTLDIIRSLAAIHPIRLIEQNPAAPGLAAAITASSCKGGTIGRHGCGFEPSARTNQRSARSITCRRSRSGDWKSLRNRRLDARMADLAPNAVPRRLGISLSAHWRARLHVRLLCNCALASARPRWAGDRLQDRL